MQLETGEHLGKNDCRDKHSTLYKPNSSVNASEGHRGYQRKSQLSKLEQLPAGVCAVRAVTPYDCRACRNANTQISNKSKQKQKIVCVQSEGEARVAQKTSSPNISPASRQYLASPLPPAVSLAQQTTAASSTAPTTFSIAPSTAKPMVPAIRPTT